MKTESKEKLKQSTTDAVVKFLIRSRIKSVLEKFLIWAEGHRRSMFLITIAFLLIVVAVSISGSLDQKKKSKIGTTLDSLKSANPLKKDIHRKPNIIEIVSIKNELDELNSKGKIVPEDSAKIQQLYKKVKSIK